MNHAEVRTGYYLVTYEWRSLGRHSSPDFRRENEVIKGCPGLWWSEHLKWYDDDWTAYQEKVKDYREQGMDLPMSEVQHATELRFLHATPITKPGFEALDGRVG